MDKNQEKSQYKLKIEINIFTVFYFIYNRLYPLTTMRKIIITPLHFKLFYYN